jgi:hypothetical protein
MSELRIRTRLTQWIAILAVLLASLAPTLGHALGNASGGSWVEVCTSQGSRWIQAAEDGSQHAPASAHLLEHCPYCSLHSPTFGLPPAPVTPLMASGVSHVVPLAFLAAPRTLHAWSSAQPRAPPLIS